MGLFRFLYRGEVAPVAISPEPFTFLNHTIKDAKPMKYIISPNYLDRSSSYRWMVREEGQMPEDARLFKSIYIPGDVVFESSSTVEEGFGCNVVAKADEFQGVDEKLPPSQPLRFDGYRAFSTPDGRKVTKARRVTLYQSGSIEAVV